MSKLRGELSKSALYPHERLTMLLRSLVGLTIQFAVIFFFLSYPGDFQKQLMNFGDALYFSAATISGVGQEGQDVNAVLMRIFHIYEGVTGILLLVLAVGIYVGRADSSDA